MSWVCRIPSQSYLTLIQRLLDKTLIGKWCFKCKAEEIYWSVKLSEKL